jgi:asparagine synthase (glutamine-hydrolysing)
LPEPGRTLFPGKTEAAPIVLDRKDASVKEGVPLDELSETLLDRLGAVVRRMGEGAGPACALSGGVDSAAILALLAREGCRAPRAYSVSDGGPGDEDLENARTLAERFGAVHEVIQLREEDLPELAEAAIMASGTLISNGRGVVKYGFYRAVARRGTPVLLSGVGADEVFMGAPGELGCVPGEPPPFLRRLRPELEMARTLLKERWAREIPRVELPTAPEGTDTFRWARKMMLRYVLPRTTLPVERNMARALGIEVRFPFLDTGILDLASALPTSVLLRGGLGKWPLREALSGTVPDGIRLQRKSPRWCPPGGSTRRARRAWWRFYGDWLSVRRVEDLEVLNHERVQRLRQDYRDMDSHDPLLPQVDAVLMKLSSLSILNEHLAG